MPDVLIAGSLHLDVIVRAPRLPHIDETLIGDGVAYRLGGKGANQAVAAARMGARAAMAGQVGSDRFGAQILAELDAASVDRKEVKRVSGDSGMSVAIVDDAGDYGAVVVSAANLGYEPSETLMARPPKVTCLQNEIPEAANLRVARAARASGSRVVLNAAPVRPVDAALLELVDILVVNRVEATGLTGESCPEVAARLLSESTAASVIATLGAEGLIFARPGEPPHAFPAFDVRACSTHGAGDMFVGALAAELAPGKTLQNSLPVAQAAAALLVSTPDDDRPSIRRDAVLALAGGEQIRQGMR